MRNELFRLSQNWAALNGWLANDQFCERVFETLEECGGNGAWFSNISRGHLGVVLMG